MLSWALTFLVVALIAGLLGFTSIAGAAMGVAKILFFVFLVLFVVSLVMHLVRGEASSHPPDDREIRASDLVGGAFCYG